VEDDAADDATRPLERDDERSPQSRTSGALRIASSDAENARSTSALPGQADGMLARVSASS
jgi:hypothetical protein